MQKILLNEDIQPLSEFRANAATFIEKIRKTKRPLVLTQRGKSSVVMMDVTEYENLIEKLEVLSDIQVAESQLKAGEGIGHDEAKRNVLDRIQR
ncbi:type II toxin-antitoxin system Phd/YefM family antitoxin [candidate division KSB1 bacterium]|nr:type II toxin-antitoxin system Phd/YefM family antitoxin [candidate division KSB1 bacterium]